MRELLDLATRAAAAAAHLLSDGWGDRSVVATKSSVTDVVTQMDQRSEALLIDLLLGERPNDSLMGEEGADRVGSSEVTWVIDPLDGTVNYLYGLPVWAVSVAAVVDDRPVVGVVNAPALGSVWRGVAGEFADCNGQPIHASAVADLGGALVATGFGYESAVRTRQGRILSDLLPRIRDIRRAGAAAVDMCWVAQGVVDAYFERGTHLWDRAAAMAICDAAGARVSGLHGGPATDGMTIVANPVLLDELRLALLEAGATDG